MSDAVGYGKPPVETRFKKGRSGNPKGRPKGCRNAATLFHQVVGEKVRVTESGRTRVITKFEAMLRQLMAKALSGDHRAMREVLTLGQLFDSATETTEVSDADKEKNLDVLRRFTQRIANMNAEKVPAIGSADQITEGDKC